MVLKKVVVGFCCVALTMFACKFGPTESNNGTLQLNLSTTAALAKAAAGVPGNIQHLWVRIVEVQIHTSGGDGWQTVATPNLDFDFLQLVKGVTVPLAIYPLAEGHYTQIRLIVADSNRIDIDGSVSPMTVPSGTQSGIKLIHQFTIDPGQATEICLDFNIDKAIHLADGKYIMHPTYKVIPCDAGVTTGNNESAELPADVPMPDQQPGDQVLTGL